VAAAGPGHPVPPGRAGHRLLTSAAGQARLATAELSPAGRPSGWGCGSWIGSPASWTRCGPSWPALLGASQAAGRCAPPTLGSARSPRWPAGPSWARPAASRPPRTPCVTPAWTSPSMPPTPSGPGPPGPPRAGQAGLGAGGGGRVRQQAQLARPWLLPGSQAPGRRSPGVISVARKLARRVHHTLRALGDQAFQPVPAG
jgi:hypothetical protein